MIQLLFCYICLIIKTTGTIINYYWSPHLLLSLFTYSQQQEMKVFDMRIKSFFDFEKNKTKQQPLYKGHICLICAALKKLLLHCSYLQLKEHPYINGTCVFVLDSLPSGYPCLEMLPVRFVVWLSDVLLWIGWSDFDSDVPCFVILTSHSEHTDVTVWKVCLRLRENWNSQTHSCASGFRVLYENKNSAPKHSFQS